MKKGLIPALLLISLLSGCHNRVEEELYNTCSTANVTYSGTIQTILNSNQCISCHSGASASGNIRLSTYSEVLVRVNNGSLYGSINHSPGFHPMPHGGGKISACDIKRIKSWIDAGAPNN
jgi:hypothetical protein